MPIVLALALTPLLAQESSPRQSSRERMGADLEFLTSPPVDGRASLTQGADAAAWFLATELRKAGLAPADGATYLQRFDLVAVRLDRDRSSVVVRQAGDQQRFAPVAVFFPDPTREIDLALDVVFAGYGVTAPEFGYDDYAGMDVRGKAVLVFDHEPQEGDPAAAFHGTGLTLHAGVWTKTWNAQQHGAAALLVVTEPVNAHRSSPRPADRANAPPQALATSELRIPRVIVPADVATTLLKGTGHTPADWQRRIDTAMRPASQSLDGVTVALLAVNETSRVQASWNVAGLLPGSDPSLRDETILVTSHYDHLGSQGGKTYPGANDNGSGTVAMVEVARLLARTRPARSVLFVSFGSEEQLMLGSYHYVAHPLRPLATTRAVINLDMIGRNEEHTPESLGAYEITAGRSDQLNLVGAAYSPELAALLRHESTGAGLALSDKFDHDSSMRTLFRCDHLPFLQKGIPAVWLFGGFHPGYHEPVDTIDRLDFDKMARVVRLTVDAVRALASTATPPRFRYPAGGGNEGVPE
ncbi:Arginyl aminopeptidase [Luteitalea pratensis]|uniref:Arginyl aminopeptidase n=1 Tax=Luteitalea pratensis TaxID=1855912 RepID=A0A143PKH1_LUTPR|nr:Arginyl aminopeptidase [Luteitalea pratensis]